MYGFLQGNTTLVAASCIGAYILLMDSPKKLVRDFSLFLLAFAGVLKIYPVLFGFLLLRENRWKDAFKAAIIFLLLFFVPFAFYGFENILAMVRNITNFGGRPAQVGNISFSTAIIDLFHINRQEGQLFVKGFILVFAALLSVVAIIAVEDNWKAATLAALLCTCLPDASKKYTLVFLIFPLIMFLNSCRKETPEPLRTGAISAALNWIYLAFFMLIFFPFPLSWKFEASLESTYQQHIDSINIIINRIAAFLFAAMLIIEGIISLYRRTRIFKNRSTNVLLITLVLIVVLNLSVFNGIRSDRSGSIYSFCGVTEENYESVKGLSIQLKPGIIAEQNFVAKRNQLTRIIIRCTTDSKTTSAPLEVAVSSCKNDKLIWKGTYDTSVFTSWSLTSLYPTEKVNLQPGEEYKIRFRSVNYKNDSSYIGLYHSIDRSDSPDTRATVNDREMDYNLAMYIFEKY